MDIAFVGIGVMGQGMVRNLMKHGHTLHVHSRRKESAEAVIGEGAVWHDTLSSCAQAADVVITIVGYPKDVEQVYFAEGGILQNARPGAVLIDMTTTSPQLAERIAEAARKQGMHALDAPVSGGDTGARNGTLAIMVGGERPVFDQCVPVFECMGKSIRYQGEAGMGQHTKMANQIAIAGTIAGAAEAVAYAKAVGLNQEEMLAAITGGAAGSWQLQNNGPKMVSGDFAPGFFIKHFIKDMALAHAEAEARGQKLPVLDQVLNTYQAMEAKGLGDEGTQALISAYVKKARD